jgi:hypothetical protein
MDSVVDDHELEVEHDGEHEASEREMSDCTQVPEEFEVDDKDRSNLDE